MTTPNDTGAHPLNKEPKSSLMWLWLLLGAIVLGLLIWAIVEAVDDEDDDLGTAAPVSPAATVTSPTPPVVTPPTSPPVTTPATTVPPPGSPSPNVGRVMVGDVDLLVPGATAASLVGQRVEANSVTVQEVVADEAFYVGPEVGRTVLVRLAKFADGQESPFKVENGDTVTFSGIVRAIDEQFLNDLRLYNPATRLERGQVYVQIEEISGVSASPAASENAS